MKFSILQQDFFPVLQAVSRSVGIRSTLPVLSNVLLASEGSNLKVAATNLEVGVIKYIKAQIQEGGEVTVPCKTLLEVISGLTGQTLDFEATQDSLSLTAGKFKANINGIASVEFPIIPLSEEKGVVFEKELLLSCSLILFAAASDEGRPILTGVLSEIQNGVMNFVATDGFRLAHRQVKLEDKKKTFKALIPRRTFEEVVHIIQEEGGDTVEITSSQNKNQAIFKIGQSTVSSRLIEGSFPSWERIIPQQISSKVVLDRVDFLQAVKLAAVFAKNEANMVTLKLLKDKIIFTSSMKELGSQQNELDCQTEGEELEIAFNGKFLTDVATAASTNQIMIEFSGPLSATLIKPVGVEGLQYIIMPVHLKGD